PDRPAPVTEIRRRVVAEPQGVDPREAELRLHVHPVQREVREAGADDDLADGLGPLVEAEAAVAGDLDPVVDQADDSPAHDEQQHREPVAGEHQSAAREVGDHVAADGGGDDHDAAHRRRAGLGVVALEVLLDGLADPPRLQPPDQQRRARQRDHQRDATGDEESDHADSTWRATSRSSNGSTRSPKSCPCSWPLPAMTTTSPAFASRSAISMAALRSASTRSAPGGAPASTWPMMSKGSSWRGLSDVRTATSARRAATAPICGRLPGSRSPPAPK